VQVKLWDPLRTRAIPERLRGVFTTRRYTNPRLPLPLPLLYDISREKICWWLINHFYVIGHESYQIRQNNAKWWPLRCSMSFKDTDFGTSRKPIYDFWLVINTNLPPILHRFQVMAVNMSYFRSRQWIALL